MKTKQVKREILLNEASTYETRLVIKLDNSTILLEFTEQELMELQFKINKRIEELNDPMYIKILCERHMWDYNNYIEQAGNSLKPIHQNKKEAIDEDM